MNRVQVLWGFLTAFFVGNALLAEFIGIKIFSLEKTLGWAPFTFIVNGERLGLELSVGVLLWPWVFITTDIINEYFGYRGVRVVSFLAAGTIAYAFLMVYVGIHLAGADFWLFQPSRAGLLDMQAAFENIFGQSLWIIFGSLVAFLIGQWVDVWSFHTIRRFTGKKWLVARATGSTLISQLIDSFVVLYIAFYWGAGWSLERVFAIATLNYLYKALLALLMTPILYGVHYVIDGFLGKERATSLIESAARSAGQSFWGIKVSE
ncbi:MAG: queuosine precursor transporter [Bacteroidia bacterium]